ncbi:MAG: type II secretion system F family protein, partial [Acidimicrobiales bacterium]
TEIARGWSHVMSPILGSMIARVVIVVLCLSGAIVLAQATLGGTARSRSTSTLRFLAERRLRGQMERLGPSSTSHRNRGSAYLAKVLGRLQMRLEVRDLLVIAGALYASIWAIIALVGWSFGLSTGSALVTGGFIAILTIGVLVGFFDQRSTRLGRSLSTSLIELVELTSILVNSGRSINSALLRASQDERHPWAPFLRKALSATDRGGAIGEELLKLAHVLAIPNFERFAELIHLHINTPELGQLLQAELATLRRNRHLQLIETLEIRSQLVWIPVSIAILIPGTILLAIPLINSLKFFSAG